MRNLKGWLVTKKVKPETENCLAVDRRKSHADSRFTGNYLFRKIGMCPGFTGFMTVFLIMAMVLIAFDVFADTGQGSGKDLLQFKAGGHIMGFQPNKVYFASVSHALSVEFLGTEGVKPAADGGGSDGKGTQTLKQVRYGSLWPGISVTYEADKGRIAKSTYRVEPGADAGRIQLCYNVPVEAQGDGALRFSFKSGYMTESAPVAWQDKEGKRVFVPVAFKLTGDRRVGFDVKGYDSRYALVIDPSYEWHTFYGSGNDDEGYAIAVDGSGNVYITGFSGASWQGDGNTNPLHAYSGNYDIVVVKLNTNGAYQWHTFYGSAGSDDYGYGIAVDGSGNVYITGGSGASWQGDGSANPLHAYSGSGDIVVVKLNTDGAYQWHTFYGSTDSQDYSRSIAIDGSGNVYVTGCSYASWQGDGFANPLHAYSGSADIVVVKLNTNGAYQWHTFYGSGNDDFGQGIAVDGSGNVYVTGYSYASWQGDGNTNPLHAYSGFYDIVVVKLNSSGAYQWHTFYGSGSGDLGSGIAVDGSGNVYVAGYSYGASWQGDGNTNPLHAYSGSYDIVVVKLNTNGAYQWHTFYGSGSDDIGQGIAVDGNGNVYVTGFSTASWQGDGNTNPLHAYSGSADIVVVKLNTDGAYQWHTFYGSAGSTDSGYGIAVDGSGNVYVTGFSREASWQGDGNTNPLHAYSGSYDIVVMKLTDTCVSPPSGMVSWWGGDNNALDIVGTNNGTLVNGATFASGKVEQAFSFDGVDDYVQTPNVINGWSEGTVDLWVKFNTVPDSVIHIFTATTSTVGDSMDLYFYNGSFVNGIYSSGWHEAAAPVTLVAGQWYHLAGSWGPQGIKLYVNGTLVGTDPTNYTGPMPPTEYNLFGAGYWTFHGAPNYINGFIDEVEIFERALIAEEIAAIYAAGSAGKCKFAITASAPGGDGSISCNPANVGSGESSSCTIFPDVGYQLQSLTDNGADVTGSVVNNKYDLSNITDNHDIVATFTIKTYSINTSAPGGHGKISCNPANVSSGGSSSCTISPDIGYHLQSLTDNADEVSGSVVNNKYDLSNITDNHNIVARFEMRNGPDLRGNWIDLAYYKKIKSLKVNVKIQNIGNRNARDFVVSFYLSSNGRDPDTLLRNITVNGLSAGKSRVLSLEYRSKCQLSGKYLVVVIDSKKHVNELNENNNRMVRLIH